MIDEEFIKRNNLTGISKEKLAALTEIVNAANSKKTDELIPYFLQATSNAQKSGISFTDSETDFIINSLKSKMSPKEAKRIDTARTLARLMQKKRTT